jgi:hypothetical protein
MGRTVKRCKAAIRKGFIGEGAMAIELFGRSRGLATHHERGLHFVELTRHYTPSHVRLHWKCRPAADSPVWTLRVCAADAAVRGLERVFRSSRGN